MNARAWFILASMALARVAFGYQYQTVATLAPDLMAAYRFDYTELGTLIGVFIAPGILLALPLGLLGRRFGERVVLAAGLLLMTVGPVISAAVGGTGGIAAGRIVAGCGAVSVMVLQNKIIADWFVGRWFMIGLSLSVAAYPVGVSAAQVVLPPLTAHTGLPVAFLSGSAVVGLTTILFLACYRQAPHAAPVQRRFSMPSRPECGLVMIAGGIWSAYTGAFSGYVSYLPSLMNARGRPEVLTAVLIAIVTWGSVAATLMGATLSSRVGAFRLLAITMSVAAIAACGIAQGFVPILCSVLFGFVGSFAAPAIMAAGTLSAQPENRAVGMGLFYTTYYVGNAIAPTLCGRAADLLHDPAGAFYAAAFIILLAIPLWMLHARLGGHGTDAAASRLAAAAPRR